MTRTLRTLGPVVLLLTCVTLVRADQPVYREAPDDPPAAVDPRADRLARSPGRRVQVGAYTSVQVNVDEVGLNILGDAANEPSIAVDPLDGDNIVVGWRQFDNVASNFRQGGWAYSSDGGASWTFPGVLESGVFRSDPVLDSDLEGLFYYNSLEGDFSMDVWRSPTAGESWLPPVPAFGGDKNWLTVDKSLTATSGHIYGIWQRFAGCCGPSTLTRSVDGGGSYLPPEAPPSSPTFGTLAVGPDGSLYAAGVEGSQFLNFSVFVVDRRQPNGQWSGGPVPLGGSMTLGGSPNPGGLLGQANIGVDSSSGPTAGNVYLLASVNPPGSDPMDVYVARSTDSGATWDPPVRVNNDSSPSAWQWLAAHSVAPNGRIDAIWLDTRNTGSATLSELYYAYSWDGGETWFENVQVSPAFDSTIGWPNQDKIGDYMTLVSNASAADAIYPATFNGEQDVYYVSVFPDCNGNGISDVEDIANQTSADLNGNRIPDECEGLLQMSAPVPGVAGQQNTFTAQGATPGKEIFFVGGLLPGAHEVPGCQGTVGMKEVKVLGVDSADEQGTASISLEVPAALAGRTALFQAVELVSCGISNLVEFGFP